jgi:hypothetical protein
MYLFKDGWIWADLNGSIAQCSSLEKPPVHAEPADCELAHRFAFGAVSSAVCGQNVT